MQSLTTIEELEKIKYKKDFLNSYAQSELLEMEVLLSRQTPSRESSTFRWFILCNYSEVYLMYSKVIEDFGNYLLLENGLGKITREGYQRFISIVFNRLKTENPTNEELQEHIIWMNNKEYSNSHIMNTSLAIEHFTKFNKNPLKIAKRRRPKTLIKYVLTEAEVAMMIRFTNNIREKSMLCVLAYSGIRNREFCNLKVEDIDIGNNKLIIKNGKYSKDRKVDMGSLCSNVLMDYLLQYKKNKEDYLFTTIKNNNKYHPGDLRKLVKVIAKRVKIEKRVFPHLFRHTLATNLMVRGASIYLIKDQMGHKNIETTVLYSLRLPYQIEKEYEKFMPSYL